MAITIEGAPILNIEEGSIISELIRIFKEFPGSLEFFIEIFNQFPNKNKYSDEKLTRLIEEDLKRVYINVSESTCKHIVEAVKLMYQNNENELSDLRGDLVEIIVADIGPTSHELKTNPYLVIKDGQFFHDGNRIGEEIGHSDSNVDSIFHSQKEYENMNDVCCESFECKASLQSYLYVVQGKRPPKIIDNKRYDKLKYLEYLKSFFSVSKEFNISFATFQRNLQNDYKKLKRMNIKLDLRGGTDISEAWLRKYS